MTVNEVIKCYLIAEMERRGLKEGVGVAGGGDMCLKHPYINGTCLINHHWKSIRNIHIQSYKFPCATLIK